jgi:CDP-diacylglycerol--glycerol-3-phosphate 3-phosphatidyltransferase
VIVFLIGGMMDILDGRVARETGLASKFGSFYDSTLDRVSEIVVYFSLYAYFRPLPDFWWVGYVVIAAMVGSLMVSYTRAKAEALGVECKVGLMQRAERVVLLGVGGALTPLAGAIRSEWQYVPLLLALGLIAVLANLTALERIHTVYTVARGVPLDEAVPRSTDPEKGVAG